MAGEYMLVVRVRARMGKKWNGSSSLLEVAVILSSVGSKTLTVTGGRSTISSECICSAVGSTDDPILTSSSSSLSSYTGNNRVGLTGIVLVGLSGNETHDMPGFTSLSSTRLSGTCLSLNSPYLPCLNSRSHAVQTYSASGELRSGFPNERPVGTTGPRIFGGSAERPGDEGVDCFCRSCRWEGRHARASHPIPCYQRSIPISSLVRRLAER